MKRAPLIILFLCSWLVQAQDYVVTAKNDTLIGIATIYDYDIIDRVELVKDQKKNNFTAIQVKGVFMKGEMYHPIRTENGYRMMKLIRYGHLSLYKGRRSNQYGNSYGYDVQYLVKRDGNVLEEPNIGFKKLMIRFLDDCKSLEDKMTKENLAKKDIDRIITLYNACIESQTWQKLVETPPSVDPSDPALVALGELKSKLEASQLATQKDAIDILNDMSNKVKSHQAVPNYLIESLKGILKDSPEYQSDVEKVTSLLAKK